MRAAGIPFVDAGVAVADNSRAEMEALEDLDFEAEGGNEAVNPKLPLDKAWMDKFSRRKPAEHGKVTMGTSGQAIT